LLTTDKLEMTNLQLESNSVKYPAMNLFIWKQACDRKSLHYPPLPLEIPTI